MILYKIEYFIITTPYCRSSSSHNCCLHTISALYFALLIIKYFRKCISNY